MMSCGESYLNTNFMNIQATYPQHGFGVEYEELGALDTASLRKIGVFKWWI